MNVDQKIANDIAKRYFDTDKTLIRLGWGISGFVYLSPDTRTAVKVHRHAESFERELYVYRKLARLKINRLHGLTIPKLRDNRADVKLLNMDICMFPVSFGLRRRRLISTGFHRRCHGAVDGGYRRNVRPQRFHSAHGLPFAHATQPLLHGLSTE